MYTVLYDSEIIHDSSSPNKEMHLINPILKMGESIAGSFSFTMLPDNPGYSLVKRMSGSIIIIKKSTRNVIWTGRVVSETEDFWKRRSCVCEGALAFLNDSIQELKTYRDQEMTTFLQTLLRIHNSKVPSNRQIVLGAVTVHDMNDKHVYSTKYRSTWDEFQENIMDRLGGHVRLRYMGDEPELPRLDYLSDYPRSAVQEINFGENLLDFTKNWDLSNLFTVILPRGKQLEGDSDGNADYVSIASVNNGIKYVSNQEAVNTYGRIEKIVDFNDVEDPSVLLSLANSYITSQQFDEMQLEVSAIDLRNITWRTTSFELLDNVHCISYPHGMDTWFPITEMEVPLDRPESVIYTMGKAMSVSMSGKSASDSNNFITTIQNLPSLTNLLGSAKAYATELLNSVTTGYVNIISENDTSQALVISNTSDLENATKMWRFNMNGLGYIDKEKSQNYNLAITMDGTIVADFIKTGVISDGVGLNYWNLSTGEFQLAYNSEFINSVGETVSMGDIVTTAYSAAVISETAYHNESGGDNLLKGVSKNHALLNGNAKSRWADGTWDGLDGPGGHSRVSKSVVLSENQQMPKPHSAIPTYDKFQNIAARDFLSTKTPTYITQRGVPVNTDTVYTLSCYARTDVDYSPKPKLVIVVGAEQNIGSNDDLTAVASTDIDSTWKRYSFTIKIVKPSDSEEAKKSNQIAVCTDYNYVNVMFGTMLPLSSTVYLAGLKMERGNVASDWSSTSDDVTSTSIEAANKYSDIVRNDSVTYTNKTATQITTELNNRINDAYDDSVLYTNQAKTYLKNFYTDTEIMNRLTKNGQRKGIYMKNNQLYINATYLASGSLSADLLQVGIIKDKKNISSWNLDTGYFSSKSLKAENANITGTFVSYANVPHAWGQVPPDRLTISGRSIMMASSTGGSNYRWDAYLQFGNTVIGTTGNSVGLTIASANDIIIAPRRNLYFGTTDYNGTVTNIIKALDKKIEIPYYVPDPNNSYLRWVRHKVILTIQRGMITSVDQN